MCRSFDYLNPTRCKNGPGDIESHPTHCRDPLGNYSFASLADYWDSWNRAYLASSSARTPRIFVRYEDLLLQPRRTLQRLCPLFGARPTADVRLPTRGSSPKEFKAVYTNAARLTNATAALQPYTLADRAIMESKMGETMRLLGYRLP